MLSSRNRRDGRTRSRELEAIAAVDQAHVARIGPDERVEVALSRHHRAPRQLDQRVGLRRVTPRTRSGGTHTALRGGRAAAAASARTGRRRASAVEARRGAAGRVRAGRQAARDAEVLVVAIANQGRRRQRRHAADEPLGVRDGLTAQPLEPRLPSRGASSSPGTSAGNASVISALVSLASSSTSGPTRWRSRPGHRGQPPGREVLELVDDVRAGDAGAHEPVAERAARPRAPNAYSTAAPPRAAPGRSSG